jgi:hypothetical protein
VRRLATSCVTAAVLLIACLAVGTAGAAAGKTGSDCIIQTGVGPVDLNAFYGVSAQIVIPPCNRIASGQRWTVGAIWTMNFSFASTAPEFVPAGSTPLADFLAKFSSLKYVVDPGTDEQKTYVVPNGPKLWIGASPVGNGLPTVNTLTLTTLPPLSVGTHVVAAYWTFSRMHCDGLGSMVTSGQIAGSGANCITAGEHLYWAVPFQVTADSQ